MATRIRAVVRRRMLAELAEKEKAEGQDEGQNDHDNEEQ